MKVFFDQHYVGAEYAFDTTRKASHVAEALEAGRVDGIEMATPAGSHRAIAEQHIEQVHAAEYVDAIRTGADTALARTNGFDWDPGIWRMAVHSTAGVIAATEAAVRDGVGGSLSSGLHHAKPDNGEGFCTVNGLVVAASAHLERHPDDRVVIVDVDAHCGGGTAACLVSAGLTDRVQHLDIYTSSFDLYRPVGPDDVLVRGGDTDEEYLSDVAVLLNSIDWEQTDLVLYNAGMDPHPGISAEALAHRERLMFEQAVANDTPVAWVLAGGYTWGITMDELVDLHLLTVRAAIRSSRPHRTGDVPV